MDFELSHFDGYLHFFAAANLAYAGSEPFRTALDNQILRIANEVPKSIKNELEKLDNKMIILKAESGFSSDPIRSKIDSIAKKFYEKCDTINTKIDVANEETIGLSKSMFLFSGFYCIALLIISGYQQFFESKLSLGCTMIALHISASYILILFLLGFSKKAPKRQISFLLPIAIIVIALLLARFHCSAHLASDKSENVLTDRTNATIALTLAFSPYLLHILRVYAKKVTYWVKFKIIDFNTKNQIDILNEIMDFTYSKRNSIRMMRPIIFFFSYSYKAIKNVLAKLKFWA